jgi:hypothetical protein
VTSPGRGQQRRTNRPGTFIEEVSLMAQETETMIRETARILQSSRWQLLVSAGTSRTTVSLRL